jgi:transketolase
MGRSKLPILKTEDGDIFYKMEYNFEYGKADLLRVGNHGTVLVTGTPAPELSRLWICFATREFFPSCITSPVPARLNFPSWRKIARRGKAVTIEDHNVNGGLGSFLADRLMEEGLCASLHKIGVKDYPVSGAADELYKRAGMDPATTGRKNLRLDPGKQLIKQRQSL